VQYNSNLIFGILLTTRLVPGYNTILYSEKFVKCVCKSWVKVEESNEIFQWFYIQRGLSPKIFDNLARGLSPFWIPRSKSLLAMYFSCLHRPYCKVVFTERFSMYKWIKTKWTYRIDTTEHQIFVLLFTYGI